MKTGLIVIAVLLILFVLIVFLTWLKIKRMGGYDAEGPETVKVSKDDNFQTILKKFNVPEQYFKVVIAQSRSYSIINCPAVLWKENDIVKVLVLKIQPELYEEEAEDFLFITSAPFVNFKQLDGTYFPDWSVQSKEIKELFLPYAEVGTAAGGIDYKRQQYWAGTMCVYARSLAEIFRMMGRPLSDYEITVDNVARMKEDGSIPADMLAEREAEKAASRAEAEAAEKAASQNNDMTAVWEAIRRLENQSSDNGISTEDINRLNAYLISQKRFDDLERSTKDSDYQKALLEELKKLI